MSVRVLINAFSARRGGIATYTRNMIATMSRTGVEATLAVPPELAKSNEAIIPIDLAGYGALRRFLWEQVVWRRVVKRINPDVLFSSANFGLLKSPVRQLLLMREGGLFNPFYLRYVFPDLALHRRWMNLLRRYLMRLSIRHADRIMFPSETLRDWVAEFEPALLKKAVINVYGINLGLFSPRSPVLDHTNDPIRITYVSVYYPHKDPLVLTRAMQTLRAHGRRVRARVTMDRNDFEPWPEMMPVYETLLAEEKAGNVILGSVRSDQLSAHYNQSDIFVFPSVSETFGFPLVEAMAAGVPIVAADTLTNREICGPMALYFPAGDDATLAARIETLIDKPDLYEWMSIGGRERALKNYDWTSHRDRLAAILKDLSTSSRLPSTHPDP